MAERTVWSEDLVKQFRDPHCWASHAEEEAPADGITLRAAHGEVCTSTLACNNKPRHAPIGRLGLVVTASSF
jgi:hypothetical protein